MKQKIQRAGENICHSICRYAQVPSVSALANDTCVRTLYVVALWPMAECGYWMLVIFLCVSCECVVSVVKSVSSFSHVLYAQAKTVLYICFPTIFVTEVTLLPRSEFRYCPWDVPAHCYNSIQK